MTEYQASRHYLAGSSGDLSITPTPDYVRKERNVMVPMRDGVRQGYVVMLVDTRGMGLPEGDPAPFSPIAGTNAYCRRSPLDVVACLRTATATRQRGVPRHGLLRAITMCKCDRIRV